MKGYVFNLLEQIVSRGYGEDTWDALLEAGDLDGVYASLGSYPDADLMKLVGAAAEELDLSTGDVVRWFGRNALPLFEAQYPSSSSLTTRRSRSFSPSTRSFIRGSASSIRVPMCPSSISPPATGYW